MSEQTLGDRAERLAANFDGTEFTECFPTSEGVSFRSKLGTAASRDVEDFVETADAPSDSEWTDATSLLNGWTGTVSYKMTLGHMTVTSTNLNGTNATADAVLNFTADRVPERSIGISVRSAGNVVSAGLISSTTGNLVITSRLGGTYFNATYPVI